MLEQVEKTTGKRPAELDGPECPPLLEPLWMMFCQVSRGRTSNGFGANPLTWADIEAWGRLTATDPSPWEIDLLVTLDNLWLVQTHKSSETKKKAKPASPPPRKR
jgi:hypothetical protein